MLKYLTAVRTFLPEIVFAGFCLRIIVFGAGIGDAIALVSMVAIYGFHSYLSSKRVDQYEDLSKEIENIKNSMIGLKLNQGLSTKRVGTPNNEQAQTKRFF